MRNVMLVGLLTALALAAPAAHAQSGAYGGPYYFSDGAGDGMLTLATVGATRAAGLLQPIRVHLWQNGQTFDGSGTYLSSGDPQGSALTPLSFVLTRGGSTSVFEIQLMATNALGGQGTFWALGTPEQPSVWWMTTATFPINAQPALAGGWTGKTFNEAFGGTYQATANGPAGTLATWTASNIVGRQVGAQVELSVYLPRSATPGVLPRTSRALYHVAAQDYTDTGSLTTRAADSQPVNQSVSGSGWIVIGRFPAAPTMSISLSAATGEPAGTRSVVANAIRLRLVQ